MIGVGQEFPEFDMHGVDENNEMCSVHSWDISGWSIIYFYPKDFTFICPTEIAGFDTLVSDDVTVIGISGDNEFCKQAWRTANGGIRNINHTLAADSGLHLGNALGIVDGDNGVHYRATYIVDEGNVIQHVSVNALDTGRNHEEIGRTLQSLQEDGLTGCNWQPGDDYVA